MSAKYDAMTGIVAFWVMDWLMGLSKRKWFAIFVILCCSSPVTASVVYLDGSHSVTFQFPNFHDAEMPSFISYKDNGYEMTVEKGDIWQTIHLKVQLKALETSSPFPVNRSRIPSEVRPYLKASELIQSENKAILALKNSLIQRSSPKTIADYVKACVLYAKNNVVYDLSVPQNALSALKGKRGSCVGISCLVIALLRAANIPARSVLGYNPPGHSWGAQEKVFGVSQTGGGFHMWMEVYYPDAGWVMCDPANSLNHVDVYHWTMEVARDENVNPRFLKKIGDSMQAARTSIEQLEERKNIRIVGVAKDPSLGNANIYGRGTVNDSFTPLASIALQILGADSGRPIIKPTVQLFRGSSSRFRVVKGDEQGKILIEGLEPGEYYYRCLAKGYSRTKKKMLNLKNGALFEKMVLLSPGGEIKCVVRDARNRPVRIGEVVLWSKKGGEGYPLQSDGTFTFEGVLPGFYSVSVKSPRYKEKHYPVTVKAGQTSTLNIVMR